MDKSVAEMNIAHYRNLLKTEVDETKRALIETLLQREEATLSRIENERRKKNVRLSYR